MLISRPIGLYPIEEGRQSPECHPQEGTVPGYHKCKSLVDTFPLHALVRPETPASSDNKHIGRAQPNADSARGQKQNIRLMRVASASHSKLEC